MTIDEKIKALGLILPPPPLPKGVYKPALTVGSFLYLSGHGPVQADGSLITGRVGSDMDADGGKQAARQIGLTMLSSIQAALGTLNTVKRVVKVFGMVNCTADFEKHPYVINGFSELMAAIWGEQDGIGVRSAVGMGSLPDNIPVEVEAVFELAGKP